MTLKEPAQKWAAKILKNVKIHKKSNEQNKLKLEKYNIKKEVKRLEDYYLKRIGESINDT